MPLVARDMVGNKIVPVSKQRVLIKLGEVYVATKTLSNVEKTGEWKDYIKVIIPCTMYTMHDGQLAEVGISSSSSRGNWAWCPVDQLRVLDDDLTPAQKILYGK